MTEINKKIENIFRNFTSAGQLVEEISQDALDIYSRAEGGHNETISKQIKQSYESQLNSALNLNKSIGRIHESLGDVYLISAFSKRQDQLADAIKIEKVKELIKNGALIEDVLEELPQNLNQNDVKKKLEAVLKQLSDEEKKDYYQKRFINAYKKSFTRPKDQEVMELYLKQLTDMFFSSISEADFANQSFMTFLNMLYDSRLGILRQRGSLEKFITLIESNLPHGHPNLELLGRVKSTLSSELVKFQPIYNSIFNVVKEEAIIRNPKVFNAIFNVSKQLKLVSGNYDIVDKARYINAVGNLFQVISSLDVERKEEKMYKILHELGRLNPNLARYNNEIKLREPLLTYAKEQFKNKYSHLEKEQERKVSELFDTLIQPGSFGVSDSYILSPNFTSSAQKEAVREKLELLLQDQLPTETLLKSQLVDNAESIVNSVMNEAYECLHIEINPQVKSKVAEMAEDYVQKELRDRISNKIFENLAGTTIQVEEIRDSNLPDLMIELQEVIDWKSASPYNLYEYSTKLYKAIQKFSPNEDQLLGVLKQTVPHSFKDQFRQVYKNVSLQIECAKLLEKIEAENSEQDLSLLLDNKNLLEKSSKELALFILDIDDLKGQLNSQDHKLIKLLDDYTEKVTELRAGKILNSPMQDAGITLEFNFQTILGKQSAFSQLLTTLTKVGTSDSTDIDKKAKKLSEIMLETAPMELVEKVIEGQQKIGDKIGLTNVEKIIDFFVELLKSIGLVENHNKSIADAIKRISDLAEVEERHSYKKDEALNETKVKAFAKRILEKREDIARG